MDFSKNNGFLLPLANTIINLSCVKWTMQRKKPMQKKEIRDFFWLVTINQQYACYIWRCGIHFVMFTLQLRRWSRNDAWSGRGGHGDDGVDNVDGKYRGGNVAFANNSQIEYFFTFHRDVAACSLACLFIQFGMHAYMYIWLFRSIESFLRSLSTSDIHTFLLLRIFFSPYLAVLST